MKRLPQAFLPMVLGLSLLVPLLRGAEIHEAAKSGDLARVQALIDQVPGLAYVTDETGRTPLHWACRGVHIDVVKYLIGRGADVNVRDNAGITPLHSVASRGHVEAVRILIEKRARLEAVTSGGATPLHLAAANGHMEIAALLAEKGAPLHVRDDKDDTPLHSAASANHWEIVELLVARIPSGSPKPSNLADYDGNTLLHLACRSNRLDIVRRLVAAGTDLSLRNTVGKTAFSVADQGGFKDIAAFLAQHGADQSPARFPKLSGPYLGQSSPGMIPRLFAKGIVSCRQGMYGTIVFSPALDEAFWKPEDKNMFSTKIVNGDWSVPRAFPNPEDDAVNVPFYSFDGRRLYFMRGKLGTSGFLEKESIWYIERTGPEWSAPKPFDPIINSQSMHWQFSMDRAGNVYTSADNIFCARFENGKYLAPERLPPPINENHTEKDQYRSGEFDPFISPRGDYLIFTKLKEGFGLFVSFRKKDGAWTEPRNLSEKLQTEGSDSAAKVSPDGKYLFFQSVRKGSGASRGLFWVDARVIDSLRSKDQEPAP
jgi:ankyrin repeat protein